MTTDDESVNVPRSKQRQIKFADVRLAVELVLMVATVIATIYAAVSASAARDAARASSDQVWQSSYQSVYERQLAMYDDLKDSKVAPYVFGGKEAPERGKDLKVDLALYYALDFYNYVFVQTAPLADGEQHLELASRGDTRPEGIVAADWRDWITWSSTIRDGISNAPSLCDRLRKSATAYLKEFVDAVESLDTCQR